MNITKIRNLLSECKSVEQHCDRVSSLVLAVSKELDLPGVDNLVLAAQLHDIGKLTWPREYFMKRPLDVSDWEFIRYHPVVGSRMVEYVCPGAEDIVKELVYSHHERPGGGGYPNGLKDPGIEILVIAACDTFDAMTSEREYRPGIIYKPSQAIETISAFAPGFVVAALSESVRVYDQIEGGDITDKVKAG